MSESMGHNEGRVRLDMLAHDARRGLDRVARGEADAIEGWLIYGAALNEGRALFPGDREFGQWVEEMCNGNLPVHVEPHERAAAMWAARAPDEFAEAKAAGNARTVRGIHAKWKEIEAAREAEQERKRAEAAKREAEAKAKAEAEARREAEAAKDAAQREAATAKAEAAAAEREAAEAESRKAQKVAAKAEKKAKKLAKGRSGEEQPVRGTAGTGDNEWYTPVDHVERARAALGGFDLDPASSDAAQETIRAAEFFDAATDGLKQEWHGRVWLNPPYAKGVVEKFMAKLRAEIEAGRVTEAIALTHNYTDTRWFQATASMAAAICFPRGRVKFYKPDGEVAAPTQGQALFYFGPDPSAFIVEFRSVGFVVELAR